MELIVNKKPPVEAIATMIFDRGYGSGVRHVSLLLFARSFLYSLED
ncbi:MAG: hypothetical protein KGN01_03705 [Patescibacteria group bacterium]|nr:hypothetical protein [Patescibacteria group bacterium]